MLIKSFAVAILFVAIGTLPSSAAVVGFESESGVLGSNFTNGTSGAVQFISISTDRINLGNPGNVNRMATYTVTFPTNGTYHLYARVRIGPDAPNDDSFFYANGFGMKSSTTDADWITVNGLGSIGFNSSTDVVTGGGAAGSGIWKWINLSQFTGQPGFAVSAGNLTQPFQIGARENGLDLDKFVFGTAGYAFTVSNLDNGTDGPPPPPPSATIDTTKVFQTIEGLGGATCFYAGWITAHPYKLEIFTNAFAGLNISMLRLGDWYRYNANFGSSGGDGPVASEIVANGNRVLGHPVPVYMSSWSPPAFLKNNGEVANGGSLIYTNGGFAYDSFAQYWYDSIQAYKANGVNLTWASIQNEPDFVATYDSCVLKPNEEGTNFASYSKALDAVYKKLTNLPSPPKLLAPEVVHVAYNDLKNYAATMNPNSFYGVAHHLYGDGGGTGDSFLSNISSATNVFPNKPRFMTEYGDVSDMIECANLIHNSLVVEQVSGYNHWNLVWPGTNGGLIQIENPFASQSTWTNAPPGTPTQSHGWWYSPSYWSMKHFSYFIQPGYRRVSVTDSDNNVRSSAFLSPDGLRLVVVLINTNPAVASTMNFNLGTFSNGMSSVYQTANTNYYFKPLGSLTNTQVLPPRSLTTVVVDKIVVVGAATNPAPARGAVNAAVSATLSWTPGSNALTHAVYLGTSSNAVAQAAAASLEFRGSLTNNFFNPALLGGTTYFWRVDEIAGVNTNTGSVWSYSTAPAPALVHRYGFSETNGTTVADSASGPGWNGTLPNAGTFSSGQLTLSSSSQQYVSLPARIVSTLTNFTIETWVKLNSTTNWSRIFDFGNNTTTYMFLTPQSGDSPNRLRFAITTSGNAGEQQISGTSALAAGVWYHVVVTHNVNTGVLYLNGVAVGTNTSMTLKPSSLGNTANNYIGKSQWPDPYFNGLIDEFRIYNVGLSSAEIAATAALGPGQLLSTNSPPMSLTRTGINLTQSWPLASAGYNLQSRTNLVLGDWANVVSLAPQIIGGQWQVTLPVSDGISSIYYRLVK